MNALERLRPEPQPIDAEWSSATLQHILASSEPTAARPHPKAPRRVVAGAMAAAAAIAAAVVGSTTLGPSAAFAVEKDGDGDVVVTIHRLTDSAGLEKALDEHGIKAQVTYLQTEVASDLGDGSGPSPCADDQQVGATVDPTDDGGYAVTFEPEYLASHQGSELFLAVAGGDLAGDWAWTGMRIGWSDGRC